MPDNFGSELHDQALNSPSVFVCLKGQFRAHVSYLNYLYLHARSYHTFPFLLHCAPYNWRGTRLVLEWAPKWVSRMVKTRPPLPFNNHD
jgi:hypothetical protein